MCYTPFRLDDFWRRGLALIQIGGARGVWLGDWFGAESVSPADGELPVAASRLEYLSEASDGAPLADRQSCEAMLAATGAQGGLTARAGL